MEINQPILIFIPACFIPSLFGRVDWQKSLIVIFVTAHCNRYLYTSYSSYLIIVLVRSSWWEWGDISIHYSQSKFALVQWHKLCRSQTFPVRSYTCIYITLDDYLRLILINFHTSNNCTKRELNAIRCSLHIFFHTSTNFLLYLTTLYILPCCNAFSAHTRMSFESSDRERDGDS